MTKFEEWMRGERPSRPWCFISLALVAVVGVFDRSTGFELNFFAFYLIPVIFGVWFVSRGFGVVVSILSVTVSMVGDHLAGAHYSNPIVVIWNTIIALSFYAVVVLILDRLRLLHNQLEARVRERTAALQGEMQERVRLEEEILSISEREQRRIGHDLHDSLCQHLTGVALAGEVLREQLVARKLPEAQAVERIVGMVEGAIELTRTLARGLHPFELRGERFTDALRELTVTISEGFKVSCRFVCDQSVMIREERDAVHLYRLTQEAIANAFKHSKSKEILVSLETDQGGATLSITDQGIGLPENLPNTHQGMGLRIMAYRASVIGADFHLESARPTGTRVVCRIPQNLWQ